MFFRQFRAQPWSVPIELGCLFMFQTCVSRKILTRFGIGLSVGIGGLLGVANPALSTPDPIFEPILDDITNSAPEGWEIRLPQSVPTEVALYPFVDPEVTPYGSLAVRMGTEPDCYEADCYGAIIFVTQEPPAWPADNGNLTSVDLGNGVEGYVATNGEQGQIQWIQDDLLYMFMYSYEVIPESEGMAIAESMVSQTPIGTSGSDVDDPTMDSETEDPTLSPETEDPTLSPETDDPTLSPETNDSTLTPEAEDPALSPATDDPTLSPETDDPTLSPETDEPTLTPEAEDPTLSPEMDEPTVSPEDESLTPGGGAQDLTPTQDGEEPTFDSGTGDPIPTPEAEDPTLDSGAEEEPVPNSESEDPLLSPEADDPTLDSETDEDPTISPLE